MTKQFVVKRIGSPWEADILEENEKVASLQKEGNLNFVVRLSKDGKTLRLTPKVDGAIRPFSFEVSEEGAPILKIKNNLFFHNGQIYVLKNVSEGRPMSQHILGSRYISRLVNFPFTKMEDIDPEIRERLNRFRGIEVGELSGFGANGHKVKLSEELEDIGIPLAAASYLMYSSG